VSVLASQTTWIGHTVCLSRLSPSEQPATFSTRSNQDTASAGGELLGRIFVPHRVSNVTFGGPAKNRLFVGGSTTLYAIFLNRRGVQVP
jgi:hypothetical protein